MRLRITFLLLLPLLAAASGLQAQPDLGWVDNSFWSYPLVPTNQPHTPPHVLLPEVLYGNSEVTYLHFQGSNTGDMAADGLFQAEMFADGELIFAVTNGFIIPDQSFYGNDLGPVTIRGGRHALTIVHDAWDQIAESNEDNNTWGRQFVWTPLPLPVDGLLIRDEPPAPYGGWEELAVPAVAANCAGFEFLSTTNWSGVALSALDDSSDYDLFLYEEPAAWDDGFVSPVAQSQLLGGTADFVLVNGQQTGVTPFNAGVTNYSGQGSFSIDHVPGLPLQPGITAGQVMESGQFLAIYNLDIEPHEVGEMLVQIESPLSPNYDLRIYDPDQAHGGPLNNQGYALPDEQGLTNLVYDFSQPGQYALVLTRNWIDGDSPLEITIRVLSIYMDIMPAQLATWHGPLVPRNAADATGQAVPLSSTLPGDVSGTYFNQAITGTGSYGTDGVSAVTTMDGLPLDSGFGYYLIYTDILYPGGALYTNNIGPKTIPGGRHTMVLEAVAGEMTLDYNPHNNHWGEQFVWEPAPLTFGSIAPREIRAFLYDDSDRITSGEPISPICNGHRIPTSEQYWRAVAIAPAPGNDLDLALFPPATSPKDGFEADLQLSWYPQDFIEYVLVNDNLPTLEELDVGVYRTAGESGQYWIDASTSVTTFDPLAAPLGPATLGPGELIDVHDIYLAAGIHYFRLENLAGQVDWGLQLHPRDQAYSCREFAYGSGLSFDNGPGHGESFTVEIVEPGWYGLTVYKSTSASTLESGTYRVVVSQGTSDTAETPAVAAAGIQKVSPNPFNPETTLTFAVQRDGPATVEVFDVQGALVATLVDRSLSAGTHRATWNGRDNQGRHVPSGVYLARLRAGNQHWSQKLMLVK